MEKVEVVTVPTDPDHPAFKALKDLDPDLFTEAWVERGEQPGDRMKDAIEAYVKPGTPEQRAGVFRAVPLSNWKGGRRYRLPEQVSLLGEDLD